MKDRATLGIVVLILASVLGSLGGIFLKFAFLSFTPATTFMLDYLVASIILIPWVFITKHYKISKKDVPILLLALFFLAVNSLAITFGIKYTTVIISQVLYFFTPIVVMLISRVKFKQHFTFMQIIGVVLGIIGGTIIIVQSYANTSLLTQLSFGTFQGNMLVLLAVIFWACYLVASKVFVTKYPPLTITAYSSVTNFFVGIPFVLYELHVGTFPPKHIAVESILSVLLLGIVSCLLVNFLFAWAVKYTSSFIVSCDTYIAPISAALVAIPLLGERVTPLLFVATVIIAMSFYFTSIYPLMREKNILK